MDSIEKNMRTFPILENAEAEYEQLVQRSFAFKELEVNKLVPLSVGDCVTKTELEELRKTIITVAIPEGYPNTSLSKENASLFDKRLGETIYKRMNITSSVASTIPMWQFLNISLVPDVVYWRWGDSKDHFISQRRNYLGTQWNRYYLFSKNEKTLATYQRLDESQIADLYERTSTRGYPDHIANIAMWFEELRDENRTRIKNERDLFRKVIPLYNMELGYRLYFALSEEERKEIFTECFYNAI